MKANELAFPARSPRSPTRWQFYSEVTGQYYDLHDTCCATASIQWDSAALGFVAVAGLPNPWTREWDNFRSFYTSLGHEASTFQGANVKKHVAAGIMWAVRREHLFR